jgi:hypothetical protein
MQEKRKTLTEVRESTSTTMQGKSVLSFKEAIKQAENQIEAGYFPRHQAVYARDVCRVIAEIYMMPEGASVKIEGEMLPATVVKEVFAELEHEHVQYVLDELTNYEGRVFAMKLFIRTMLYNAVLTMESHYNNRYNADRAEGKI